MRRLIATAALGCAALALHAVPALAQTAKPRSVSAESLDAEKVALGREIVLLGYPPEVRNAMFMGVIDQMIGQMNQAGAQSRAGLDADTIKYLDSMQIKMVADLKQVVVRHIPSLMDGIALAYADQFSLQELQDIRDFVATPSGQAFVSRSSELLSNRYYTAATQPYFDEVMAMTRDWQKRIVAELLERRRAQ